MLWVASRLAHVPVAVKVAPSKNGCKCVYVCYVSGPITCSTKTNNVEARVMFLLLDTERIWDAPGGLVCLIHAWCAVSVSSPSDSVEARLV